MGETGSIGSPLALWGIGCVGQGSSPSWSVAVDTGVSMIGCTGSPLARSRM